VLEDSVYICTINIHKSASGIRLRHLMQ
jgi:hypothetical protein